MNGKYDFERAMTPFWRSPIQYDETVLMVTDGTRLPEARLLFRPSAILSATDARMTTEYVYGVDWMYDAAANVVRLLPGTRAPYMTLQELYPDSMREDTQFRRGGGFVFFQWDAYFHDRQLAFTYRTEGARWQVPVPVYDESRLPRTLGRLKGGLPLKIVVYGDSIAAGADCSWLSRVPPHLPPWGELVAMKLRSRFASDVSLVNASAAGMGVEWGAEHAEERVASVKPDLVIVAFGMNDGILVHPAEFREKTSAIMRTVASANPEAEFILVTTMLPNPETVFFGHQARYAAQLRSLTRSGVALADMTGVHGELLEYKRYWDMTGNNVNHPNDYLNRWYAQIVSALLVPV